MHVVAVIPERHPNKKGLTNNQTGETGACC